eukprot:TRINITY_DN5263_c0_g1_i1.p1 TRINITY_DN5263_c0_g1~~TRINITY_DN5263_c0_g1_i1.p1  ORF type:complete len:159 (-),score=1.19 TRINITY_DN5263_c0_g1_i1:249-725(-)
MDNVKDGEEKKRGRDEMISVMEEHCFYYCRELGKTYFGFSYDTFEKGGEMETQTETGSESEDGDGNGDGGVIEDRSGDVSETDSDTETETETESEDEIETGSETETESEDEIEIENIWVSWGEGCWMGVKTHLHYHYSEFSCVSIQNDCQWKRKTNSI